VSFSGWMLVCVRFIEIVVVCLLVDAVGGRTIFNFEVVGLDVLIYVC
jgi:hypothetical protein